MRSVNVHAAKTRFSELLEAVAAGEEIVIARAGKPMARLVAIQEPGGLVELPLHAAVSLGVADLPLLHGDLFDRLLLVQARAAGCRLFTSDGRLLRYGDPVTPI
jgi:prevent-host-death family protein